MPNVNVMGATPAETIGDDEDTNPVHMPPVAHTPSEVTCPECLGEADECQCCNGRGRLYLKMAQTRKNGLFAVYEAAGS